VDGEEPCVAEAPSREQRTGRHRHEPRGGEGAARGRGEARVATTWVCRLPNDGGIRPGVKIDVGGGGRPGEKGGNPGGFRASKGGLRAKGSSCMHLCAHVLRHL
jgi:hypothetical protein